MASITVVLSVHRRVPPYTVVVLPASLSLFCYCYYMLTDGFCHSCNICTQKNPSLPCSCPSTGWSACSLLCYCYFILTDGSCFLCGLIQLEGNRPSSSCRRPLHHPLSSFSMTVTWSLTFTVNSSSSLAVCGCSTVTTSPSNRNKIR